MLPLPGMVFVKLKSSPTRCMEAGKEQPKWPSWGPVKNCSIPPNYNPGTTCLVCNGVDKCECHNTVKDWASRAYQPGVRGYGSLKESIYRDPLLCKEIPWYRQSWFNDGKSNYRVLKCWICQNFMPRGLQTNHQKWGNEGKAVGAVRIQDFEGHTKAGDKGDHGQAMLRYKRQCAAWLAQASGEEPSAASGPIVDCMDTVRKQMDEKFMNQVHLAYTCMKLRESSKEYVTHVVVGRRHDANYYGDLCLRTTSANNHCAHYVDLVDAANDFQVWNHKLLWFCSTLME